MENFTVYYVSYIWGGVKGDPSGMCLHNFGGRGYYLPFKIRFPKFSLHTLPPHCSTHQEFL